MIDKPQSQNFEQRLDLLHEELKKGKDADVSNFVEEILTVCNAVDKEKASSLERTCVHLLQEYKTVYGKEFPEAITSNLIAARVLDNSKSSFKLPDDVSMEIARRFPPSLKSVLKQVSHSIKGIVVGAEKLEESERLKELEYIQSIFKLELPKLTQGSPLKAGEMHHEMLEALALLNDDDRSALIDKLRTSNTDEWKELRYYRFDWRTNVQHYQKNGDDNIQDLAHRGLFIKALEIFNRGGRGRGDEIKLCKTLILAMYREGRVKEGKELIKRFNEGERLNLYLALSSEMAACGDFVQLETLLDSVNADNRPLFYSQVAQDLARNNQLEQAKKYANEIPKLNEEAGKAYYAIALKLVENHNPKEALKLAKDENFNQTHLDLLAEKTTRSGFVDEALAFANELSDPDHKNYRLQEIFCSILDNDENLTNKKLFQILELFSPDSTYKDDCFSSLSYRYLGLNNFKDAIIYALKILSPPKKQHVLLGIGYSLLANNRLSELDAITGHLTPNEQSYFFYTFSLKLSEKGQFEKAIEYLYQCKNDDYFYHALQELFDGLINNKRHDFVKTLPQDLFNDLIDYLQDNRESSVQDFLENAAKDLLKHDLDKAVRLAARIRTEYRRDDYLSQAANALVEKDIDKAILAAEQINNESKRNDLLWEIANKILKTDLNRAISIANQIQDENKRGGFLWDSALSLAREGKLEDVLRVINSVSASDAKKEETRIDVANTMLPEASKNPEGIRKFVNSITDSRVKGELLDRLDRIGG